jgi:hypothetical protein
MYTICNVSRDLHCNILRDLQHLTFVSTATVNDPSKEVTAVVKRGALTLTTEPVKFLETMIKRGTESTAVWAGSIAELSDDNVYPFTVAEKAKKGKGKR